MLSYRTLAAVDLMERIKARKFSEFSADAD